MTTKDLFSWKCPFKECSNNGYYTQNNKTHRHSECIGCQAEVIFRWTTSHLMEFIGRDAMQDEWGEYLTQQDCNRFGGI